MSINKAIVVGNLGANPDIRALPSGQNVANFSLATTERFTDRNGAKQERTERHQVVAFGSSRITANACFPRDARAAARHDRLLDPRVPGDRGMSECARQGPRLSQSRECGQPR